MAPPNHAPMPPRDHERAAPPAAGRPVSALPSVQARALAFLAILVAGLCGALIGYGFVGVQCHGQCDTPEGLGALTGSALAAAGVAVVAVLTLRAMGEWRTIKDVEREDAWGDPGGAGSGP